MPMIPAGARAVVDESGADGVLCYESYKHQIDEWSALPRWRTASRLYQEVFGVDRETAAKQLAFMMLFDRRILKYEDKQELLNGTITGRFEDKGDK